MAFSKARKLEVAAQHEGWWAGITGDLAENECPYADDLKLAWLKGFEYGKAARACVEEAQHERDR